MTEKQERQLRRVMTEKLMPGRLGQCFLFIRQILRLSDAIKSLRRHKSTLQILHLDATARTGDARRAKPGVNMRDFTALQHLWISTILLCPSAPRSDRPADAETFVDFLPRSIVSLEIYRYLRCSTDNALRRLAAVKHEKFPFLKKVVYGPKNRGNLGQAF
ncbi:uncharacterized protein FPRO_06604 [Fusarium proliferatum ET1]|uniref:Uncharacterized protein n=1 Tax=Fusarium proliferatum (strain ET1) TaxID=1227346 RepID=A0A1L7VFH4_FUSPR|nr:uncharacterized protein FPRO_06604 [Fusarium proliferatum ET1]CZR38205.1 uncharacterized protein FPRO_06604 [Fusarium proliferatum ET1]